MAMGAAVRRMHAAAPDEACAAPAQIADRYELPRLRLLCESYLCKHISVNSVATTLALADRHHAMELKSVCLKFAAENLSGVPPYCCMMPHALIRVEVEFTDGSSFHLSAEFLRVHSPAADSKIISVSGEKVIFGQRYVGIMSAESVGNYAIRILFDDLHKTGIFTWDYLHHLGSKKFSLTRNYIRTLRKHGLSRDPQRRK
uniref:Uncharacterized protein n=1 Tax=Oryza barthii TaxID=65489 RepID=A0A0D3EXJ6_9ORYZ